MEKLLIMMHFCFCTLNPNWLDGTLSVSSGIGLFNLNSKTEWFSTCVGEEEAVAPAYNKKKITPIANKLPKQEAKVNFKNCFISYKGN